MSDHIIPRLLDRRGTWMTALQIFDASYPYRPRTCVVTNSPDL